MASTAITPSTLSTKAFVQKVLEEALKVIGPLDGVMYAGHPVTGKIIYQTRIDPEYVEVTQETIAQPAVNTNPATTTFATTGYLTFLDYVYLTHTADANAATRTILMAINDGTNTIWVHPLFSNTASTTAYMSYSKGVEFDNSGIRKSAALPQIAWPQGCQMLWSTASGQAGDQYSLVRYGVRRVAIP